MFFEEALALENLWTIFYIWENLFKKNFQKDFYFLLFSSFFTGSGLKPAANKVLFFSLAEYCAFFDRPWVFFLFFNILVI